MTPHVTRASTYLKLCKEIAGLALNRFLSQSVSTLSAAAVIMALLGAASPHIFSLLAVAMPWLFRAACFTYLVLACFKGGWQLTNRIRGHRQPAKHRVNIGWQRVKIVATQPDERGKSITLLLREGEARKP